MQSEPQLVTTVAQLRAALAPARRAGRRIGLVPTMGALHEGHLSLVRAAKAECDLTVATIYVNPSQFAAGEDLAKYPRTLTADLEKLAQCGADLVLRAGGRGGLPRRVTPPGSRSARSASRWRVSFGPAISAASPRWC